MVREESREGRATREDGQADANIMSKLGVHRKLHHDV
jgi:hypothetical protein